jgi:hypothetical protein
VLLVVMVVSIICVFSANDEDSVVVIVSG